jgi:hypothetical protein
MTFHVARMQQWTISCAGQGFVALLSRHACALTWRICIWLGARTYACVEPGVNCSTVCDGGLGNACSGHG